LNKHVTDNPIEIGANQGQGGEKKKQLGKKGSERKEEGSSGCWGHTAGPDFISLTTSPWPIERVAVVTGEKRQLKLRWRKRKKIYLNFARRGQMPCPSGRGSLVRAAKF